jgi:hypothetical protein
MTVFEEASLIVQVWNAALRALLEGFRRKSPTQSKGEFKWMDFLRSDE